MRSNDGRPPDDAAQHALDAFLYASVGEEANGMRLSVVSALARLGIDPWAEARRLSALPTAMAAQRLAPILGRVSGVAWKPDTAQVVAERLVQLLPRLIDGGALEAGPRAPAQASAASWLLCLVLLSTVLFVLSFRGDLSVSRIMHMPTLLGAAAGPPEAR